jgi:hypothetical protein
MSHLITYLISNFFDIDIVKLCDPNYILKKTTQLLFIKQIAKISPTPKIRTQYVFGENWNQNWNYSHFFVQN